jgi:hypothetical protein
MDLDGDLELIATCWDQNVFVWDLDAPQYHGCVEWNGFHGNQFNSGWKELSVATDASVTAWMYELGAGFLRVSWSIAGEEREWDLLRRDGDGDFELIARNLVVDGSRTLTYTDRAVEEGLVYVYRLVPSGGGEGFDTEAIEVPVASARLYQNHPNPFNPSTTIAFTVPGGADSRHTVVLGIYDVRGALVRTLVNGSVAGGRHEVTWNGDNDRGAGAASGVYFAKFMTGGTTAVKKMVLLR